MPRLLEKTIPKILEEKQNPEGESTRFELGQAMQELWKSAKAIGNIKIKPPSPRFLLTQMACFAMLPFLTSCGEETSPAPAATPAAVESTTTTNPANSSPSVQNEIKTFQDSGGPRTSANGNQVKDNKKSPIDPRK